MLIRTGRAGQRGAHRKNQLHHEGMKSTMRTKILKVIGGTLTALALTTAPVYAGDGTSSSATGASAFVCGHDAEYPLAYYNHCNSNVNVLIRVERHWPLSDYDKCVAPGRTYLGLMDDVYWSWYKGVLC
jgi:hypothetical protein